MSTACSLTVIPGSLPSLGGMGGGDLSQGITWSDGGGGGGGGDLSQGSDLSRDGGGHPPIRPGTYPPISPGTYPPPPPNQIRHLPPTVTMWPIP